jgi:hypothetical protein
MEILLMIHGFSRWTLLILALISIGFLFDRLLKKQDFDPLTAKMIRIYSIFISIQFLIGCILLFSVGSDLSWNMKALRFHMEHATFMLLSVVFAHSTAMWKSTEHSKRLRNTLIAMILSVLCIFFGVLRLKGMDYWLSLF